MDKIPVTPVGLEKLKKELFELKSIERPDVIAAIEHARSLGDLSENADYDAAKDRQQYVEGRINEIEDRIARAQVIDPKGIKSNKIMFGATVTLINLDTEEEISYQLLGEFESNIKQGKISIKSPIGRALIGKTIGDVIEVLTPRGQKSYEIVGIKYD